MSKSWITAAEAVKMLDVTSQTLYAYVSRGFIRSESVPGESRLRRYSHEDVERLRRRSEERRDPQKAASNALQWGVPVLESAITLIADGRLYYRGHDVVDLARTRSIREVTSLLWTGSFGAPDVPGLPVVPSARGQKGSGIPFVTAAESMLPLAGLKDPGAFDLRPESLARTGWRIVTLLGALAAECTKLETTIDEALAAHWNVRGRHGAAMIRAALIACADHELNVSAFTARCIASAGSNPYSVVAGALCALEGTRHGGASARVEALIEEMRHTRDLRRVLSERLRRGETIEGFSHPLYHKGDPRAKLLLSMLDEHYGSSKELRFLRAVSDAAQTVLAELPTVDFALVALQLTLRLPPRSALTLFALGRSMGWIAHAIEQYETSVSIRPRAKYVGELPPR